MKYSMRTLAVPALFFSMTATVLAASPAAPGAKVMIVEPADGATVTNPITVKFGVEKMEIVPAGTDKPHSGHHHLLIDATDMPAAGMPIAKDDRHQHFGKGQTETSITLPPGKHTLQLVLGDKDHVPHEPMVASQKITITVK